MIDIDIILCLYYLINHDLSFAHYPILLLLSQKKKLNKMYLSIGMDWTKFFILQTIFSLYIHTQ